MAVARFSSVSFLLLSCVVALSSACSDDGSDGAGPNDDRSTAGSGTGASSGDGGSSGGDGGSSGGVTATGGATAPDPIDFEFGTTTVYVAEKDQTYDTTTLGPVPGGAPLSQYGGDLSRNVGGTGFFRTEQVDDRWYLVDPDGYLFISVGMNSVILGGDIDLPTALSDIGFNTLGNWSDADDINAGAQKMPYTHKHSFMNEFVRDDVYLEGLVEAGVLPVVFTEFDDLCDTYAAELADLDDDPWLLGIFSDNELPFYNGGSLGNVLDRWVALPTDDVYYVYAANWLDGRGSSPAAISTDDHEAFAAHIIETYYSKVSAAIRRYDANHLYIGTRLHGAAKRQDFLMAALGPYVDVLSVNYYNAWTPDAENMDMWLAETNKPFIISEYYVKGADSGLGNADGAGWEVATQEERALFYTHWQIEFYSHPGAVGTHWFRYIDKAGQDSNKGFLSEQYEWYTPLRDEALNTNRQIYQLVEALR